MTFLEKLTGATFVTIGLALILTNPQGTKQAGTSIKDIYQGVVSSFFKPK